MIIDRLHYEIKARFNKLNSNHYQDFYPAELDDSINKAQDDLVEMFYSGNNSKEYKIGFEVTQQRTDMLSNLVVNSSIVPTLVTTNQYRMALPTDYKHFINGRVIMQGCSNPFTLYIVTHNDLTQKMIDVNHKPSKTWGRCLGVFRSDGLHIYSDGVVTSVEFTYIKKPRQVFISGYDTLEFLAGISGSPSSASPQQQCELNEQCHDILVEMTVQYLSRVFENNNKVLLQKEHIINKI